MKIPLIVRSLILMAVVGIWMATSTYANLYFQIDPSPEGDKFMLDTESKDVPSFSGYVNTDLVDVASIGNVNIASGWATIKPIKNGSLTELVYTPQDWNMFDGFSFRGQLEKGSSGTITLVVQDNQGDLAETFTFTSLKDNQDLERMGIIAIPGSGKTIQSITLSGEFKEQKQALFSYVPIPESSSLITDAFILLLPLGISALRKQRLS